MKSGIARCLRERRISRDLFDVIVRQYEIDEEDQLGSWLPLGRSLVEGVAAMFRTLTGDSQGSG